MTEIGRLITAMVTPMDANGHGEIRDVPQPVPGNPPPSLFGDELETCLSRSRPAGERGGVAHADSIGAGEGSRTLTELSPAGF